MKRVLAPVLGLIATAALAACQSAPEPPPIAFGSWIEFEGRAHPLAGRIWSPRAARFVEPDALVEAVAAADFAILGEVHDNADHHRLQAWLVERTFGEGRRPALAFEMIPLDQQDAVYQYQARHPRDATGLGAAVAWEARGWPDWAQYRPIAQAGMESGAPIIAADLPRPTVRRIVREGMQTLGPAALRATGLDRPMPSDLRARIRDEIFEGHCRLLPVEMLEPMTDAMVARDAQMAAAMRRGAARYGRDGAILIAGKGHGRIDRAVPFHLRHLAPTRGVVSLALVEVDDGATEPDDYGDGETAGGGGYDFLWFTPRAQRDDPCAGLAGIPRS